MLEVTQEVGFLMDAKDKMQLELEEAADQKAYDQKALQDAEMAIETSENEVEKPIQRLKAANEAHKHERDKLEAVKDSAGSFEAERKGARPLDLDTSTRIMLATLAASALGLHVAPPTTLPRVAAIVRRCPS